MSTSVADPDPFDMDPDLDPAFHFDMDLDPAFQFDMGPDPTVDTDLDPDPYHKVRVYIL